MTRPIAGSKNRQPVKDHGDATKKITPKSGKKGRSKKGSTLPNGMPKRFGAAGGYKGVKTRDALQLANAEIRTQVDQMGDQMRDFRVDRRSAVNDAKNQHTRAVGDLKHIFGETGNFIGNQNEQIANTFNQNRTTASAAQAALMQQLNANAQMNGNVADDELSRLGINGSGFMDQFDADNSNAQNVAQISGANNMANIDAMASGASSVGNLLLGMNSGSQSSSMGKSLNNRNEVIGDINSEFNRNKSQVADAIRDVRGSRGDLVKELLLQMQQTGWGQYMDRQNLGLQRAQLALQRRSQSFSEQQANAASSGSGSGSKRYDYYYHGLNKDGGSSGSSGGGSSSGTSPAILAMINSLSGGGKKKR